MRGVVVTLALVLFAWLAFGLYTSFGHNSNYLTAVSHKVELLTKHVEQLYKTPRSEAVSDTLNETRSLASHTSLDLAHPDSTYRYGLYAAPAVVEASNQAYNALEDNLLLPQIVRRIESVLSQAIASKNTKATYDALLIYLMLHDKTRYNAAEIKAWVLNDWAHTDSAAALGGRVSMAEHVQQLFSGERVVQSPFVRNETLIQQARALLDGSNATQRLYERAKAAMQKEAPDEFTLLRAVGPQAGTVFTRASDSPLSRGVPGLFTFDGYHNLFDKRLSEFVHVAQNEDAWVMGLRLSSQAQKKTAVGMAAVTGRDDPLTEAIRRLYLSEYAQQWDIFLGDIRTVNGTSLAFNLQVLRRFAAPDSPLTRLARAVVKEVTLSQPTGSVEQSLIQKASAQIGHYADKALAIRSEERIERELVDQHFSALREVVTGSPDSTPDTEKSVAPSRVTGLDGITSLLNDYYTTLAVADNALSNNSMPPPGDTAAKLKMTANTLPAPLREVLQTLAIQGSANVNQGIGQLLSRQMQVVTGDVCRLTIAGNYPFNPDSTRDVSIEDFTRLFAKGGVMDDFFSSTLAPFVDTSARPWRYRTLPGATEPVRGPSLEPFEQAQAVRDVFFGEPGQKQMAWKTSFKVAELDPSITSLTISIDGQTLLYQHGPVVPFVINWPRPRGGAEAEITANPRIRPETSTLNASGPWALMRLLQKGHVTETATRGRTRVAFDFDQRRTVLDITATSSVANPLTSDVLKTFRCPSSMSMFNLPDSGPPPGLPPGMPGTSHARQP